jgi:hypothetical protein
MGKAEGGWEGFLFFPSPDLVLARTRLKRRIISPAISREPGYQGIKGEKRIAKYTSGCSVATVCRG